MLKQHVNTKIICKYVGGALRQVFTGLKCGPSPIEPVNLWMFNEWYPFEEKYSKRVPCILSVVNFFCKY